MKKNQNLTIPVELPIYTRKLCLGRFHIERGERGGRGKRSRCGNKLMVTALPTNLRTELVQCFLIQQSVFMNLNLKSNVLINFFKTRIII